MRLTSGQTLIYSPENNTQQVSDTFQKKNFHFERSMYEKTTNDGVKKVPAMLYSPHHHIPIGQAAKAPNGEYVLRVKKDKHTYEKVSISKLLRMFVHAVDSVEGTH